MSTKENTFHRTNKKSRLSLSREQAHFLFFSLLSTFIGRMVMGIRQWSMLLKLMKFYNPQCVDTAVAYLFRQSRSAKKFNEKNLPNMGASCGLALALRQLDVAFALICLLITRINSKKKKKKSKKEKQIKLSKADNILQFFQIFCCYYWFLFFVTSLLPSHYPFSNLQSISQLLLHNNFMLCFEVLPN